MTHVIWKYPLEVKDLQKVNIPADGRVFKIDVQEGVPTIWAYVNPRNTPITCYFRTFGTGHEIRDDIAFTDYVGTYMLDGYVWHVFYDRRVYRG